MKKINLKKALASVAALSAVACMAAVPASAAEINFPTTAKTAGVSIEQVTVTMDELKAANNVVPVLVKVTPNPGVNALEFGVTIDPAQATYETVVAGKTAKTYADLATGKDASGNSVVDDGLDVKMTVKASDVEPGLTWCTYAASDVRSPARNRF